MGMTCVYPWTRITTKLYDRKNQCFPNIFFTLLICTFLVLVLYSDCTISLYNTVIHVLDTPTHAVLFCFNEFQIFFGYTFITLFLSLPLPSPTLKENVARCFPAVIKAHEEEKNSEQEPRKQYKNK